jgi:hypothetical protein
MDLDLEKSSPGCQLPNLQKKILDKKMNKQIKNRKKTGKN